MKYILVVILGLLSISAQANTGPSKAAVSAALKALHAQVPKFDWKAETAISVDINADGIDDVAFLGYTEDTAAVGVVLGSPNKGEPIVKYMDFGRGNGAGVERAMSGRTGHLVADKQGDISDELGELPEGYKICDRCYEIEVVDGEESDPMFIYWDHVAHDLSWWRA